MDARTLTKLRAAFAVLGLTLLAALFVLVSSAKARLEAQRRLRHQIVAERIFDEMERELTLLLTLEDARPSSAYDSQRTRARSWAPFVVGYFTYDEKGPHAIAREQLDPTRSARVERAASACGKGAAFEHKDRNAGVAPDTSDRVEADKFGNLEKKSAAPAAPAKQEAVLRKLNRGAEQRPQSKSKGKQARDMDDMLDDPLSGFAQ